MNETIRELLKRVEERGGSIHLAPQLPDAIAEAFLRQVLDCPDCVPQDEAREGDRTRRGGSRHSH